MAAGKSNIYGFSLVELSIVLVILGLLTGGILTGQNLIRAAELRSVITEFQAYQTAAQTFRDKYFALPGDMTNATAFWGIAAGTTGNDATCLAAVQSTVATCNGDGNGVIGKYSIIDNEEMLLWKHLANAGLIEGSYSGTLAPAGGVTSPFVSYLTHIAPGWNTPLSKVHRAHWWAGNRGGANVYIQKFYGNYVSVSASPYYGNALQLFDTALQPISNSDSGPLQPQEAWGIDKKIDDGRPGSGKVEALRGGSAADAGKCLTHADPALAEYDLDDSGNCSLVFPNAFN
jgi:prepilin-type N-terminal cleavage/methylation domain-containing protein